CLEDLRLPAVAATADQAALRDRLVVRPPRVLPRHPPRPPGPPPGGGPGKPLHRGPLAPEHLVPRPPPGLPARPLHPDRGGPGAVDLRPPHVPPSVPGPPAPMDPGALRGVARERRVAAARPLPPQPDVRDGRALALRQLPGVAGAGDRSGWCFVGLGCA